MAVGFGLLEVGILIRWYIMVYGFGLTFMGHSCFFYVGFYDVVMENSRVMMNSVLFCNI